MLFMLLRSDLPPLMNNVQLMNALRVSMRPAYTFLAAPDGRAAWKA